MNIFCTIEKSSASLDIKLTLKDLYSVSAGKPKNSLVRITASSLERESCECSLRYAKLSDNFSLCPLPISEYFSIICASYSVN